MRVKTFSGFLIALICLVSSMQAAFGIWLGPFELQLFGGGKSGSMYRVNVQDDPVCSAINNHQLMEMVLEWEEWTNNNQEQKITTKKITVEPYVYGRNIEGLLILRGNVVYEQMLKEVTIKYGVEAKEEPEEGEDEGELESEKQKSEILSEYEDEEVHENFENNNAASENNQVKNGEHNQPESKETPKKKEQQFQRIEVEFPQEEGVFSGFFQSFTKSRDRIATINIKRISQIQVIEQSNFNPPRDWKDFFRGSLVEVYCSIKSQ